MCGSRAPKGRDAALKEQPPQHPNAKGGTRHMAKKAAKKATKKGAKKR